MKGKLIRLEKTEISGNLRTKEMHGSFEEYPKEDDHFEILGEPLDNRYSFRSISTSLVVKVKHIDNSTIEFTTLSGSKYKLEIE